MNHNTYDGGNIKTCHRLILSIPEYSEKHFNFTKFVTPGTGTLRGVLDNGTKTRHKISLNGIGLEKGDPASINMILKKGIEVVEDCTVFNYGHPIPHKNL